MGAFLGAAILVLSRAAERRRSHQADAVAGDRDGLRRDRAHRARRARAGHRPAGRRWSSKVASANTVTFVAALLVGVVSVYSSTSGVVLPAFLPMVPGLTAALPGASAIAIASSMNIGGHLVDVSPLSTIGALCLAGAPPEESRVALQQAARLGPVDVRGRRDAVLSDLLKRDWESGIQGTRTKTKN